jgi:peroxiredoxin
LTLKRILLPMAFLALLGPSGDPLAAAIGPEPANPQSPAPLVPYGTSSEYAMVEAGTNAPDFSYETLAGGSARLRDLLAQGNVLLVFGASDTDLRRLQGESDQLTRLGVVPVAVLDRSVSSCRRTAKKLSLTIPVVPDPQRAIGAQYNALDPRTRQDAPAWFVVDQRRRVRGLDRFELPREPWVSVAATSLGIPPGDWPLPASNETK